MLDLADVTLGKANAGLAGPARAPQDDLAGSAAREIESAAMRREFLLVGGLVIGALSLGARQPAPQAALETRMARLQAHIENVESVRAVKRLQYPYGHDVELGRWNDFADLFWSGPYPGGWARLP